MPTLASPQQSRLVQLRRQNLLILLQEHATDTIAADGIVTGLEGLFAQKIQVSPSLLSQFKSGRPISDKMARQIEVLCRRDAGWLDVRHEPEAPSPAELAFLDLARQVWRAQNANGKRELQRLVRDFS